MQLDKVADIKENDIAELDAELLAVLLKDRSSGRNILWATDNYISRGMSYAPSCPITVKQISGKFGKVIRPRIDKSKKEQEKRIKDKAEVFTPSWICNKQNNAADNDWFGRECVFNTERGQEWITNTERITFPEGKSWQDYVKSIRLEITCGEAPYLCSRYDTTTGKWIEVNDRIGVLDRKIRVINENVTTEKDWYDWVVEAYKATYGYEWQGDSVLIARENLLYTFIDYYMARFEVPPIKEYLFEIAKILSWNIWQMDGLKYVIPNSCQPIVSEQLSFFTEWNEPKPCPGCEKNSKLQHTGVYSKIMNWATKRAITFVNIKGAKNMKFDYVIGNPPYQGENHQQVYVDFYLAGKSFGGFVDLIFPIGWQEPKNANNLGKMNNPETKTDCQIVNIDNRQNVFSGVAGAEWTNIILWKRDYDNGLDGKQLLYTNGENPQIIQLIWDKRDIEKPVELVELATIVKNAPNFTVFQTIMSPLKPYGLRTDFIDDPDKYKLPKPQSSRLLDSDIALYGMERRRAVIKYLPIDYPLPKKTVAFDKYKVFVPYAWGNMSKGYLGGAYADITIANPYEICTEMFQESGSFDSVEKARIQAKYMMTQFFRALLFVNKNSHHSTTAYGAIPVQDFSEGWWDLSIAEINEKLFDKYNVPENIRSFVRKNIQPKSEQNIVNLSRGNN